MPGVFGQIAQQAAVVGHRLHVEVGMTPLPLCQPALQLSLDQAVALSHGFNVVCNHYPKPFEDFCRQVVPELQRRGIFRTEYQGTTLRDHLGLRVPENRYTRQAREAS